MYNCLDLHFIAVVLQRPFLFSRILIYNAISCSCYRVLQYLRPFSVLSLSFLHYLYKLLLLDGYSVIRQCVSTFRCCCCFCAGFCFCWYCLSLSVGFVFWLRKLNASRRPDVSNVQWALRHGSGEVGGREERLLSGERGGGRCTGC